MNKWDIAVLSTSTEENLIDIAFERVPVAVNQEIRFVSGNLTSPYSWQHL
jgi:hypothetical protein